MANATATGRYLITTPGKVADTIASAIETDDANSTVTIIGHVAEDGLTNKPATATASPNSVELNIVTISATDSETALAAQIAGIVAVPGLTLISDAAYQVGTTDGIVLTNDAPTLVAADDTMVQTEGGAEVAMITTCVQKYGTVATIVSDIATSAPFAVGTAVGLDGGDDTYTITINSEIGDAAASPYTVTLTATDGLGQSVDEVVTITINA